MKFAVMFRTCSYLSSANVDNILLLKMFAGIFFIRALHGCLVAGQIISAVQMLVIHLSLALSA